MEVLAERLKWLRDKRRLGQKEVAANIDITLSGYQKMEYNESNPKLDTLIKLAEFFKVTSDFLLGLSDDVEEIKKLKNRVLDSKARLDMYRREMEDIREEVNKLGISRDEVKGEYRHSLRMKFEERYDYLEHSYYSTKDIFDQLVMDYFFNFYDIPFSKPENDPIIKDYLPFDIVLTEVNEKSYIVKLKALNGNYNITLAHYQCETRDESFFKAFDKGKEYRELFRLDMQSVTI